MKVTLSWLKDHLETQSSLKEICKKLIELGLEVESIHNPAEKLEKFVIGHVVIHDKHPHADRLSVCQVDIGKNELVQVICGAPNVRQNMKVVFADIGTVIPATGQILKKGKIRNLESLGMICSSAELLLGKDHDQIIDLKTQADPGTSLTDVLKLNDPVIEISLTPNRADCFSVRGIARDLAACGIGTLKPLSYKPLQGTFNSPLHITIEDSQACPDYRGVYIKNLKNGSSPEWVQRRLEAIGLRPINALVDATNYLTYDLGRPLHVYDATKIKGSLTVRLAKKGEIFYGLNGKTYDLHENMTVITDETQILSLGGLIGGESSSCDLETKDVFLECALFDPIRTAQTGRTLNLSSDARTRFERGIDTESQEYGVTAALNLILDWCGGGSPSHVIRATPLGKTEIHEKETLHLTHEQLLRVSGCDICMDKAAEILINLGFDVTHDCVHLKATVPSHRADIQRPVDLIEEILRLYGYDHIPEVPLPSVAVTVFPKTKTEIIRSTLAARGFNETITWSFLSEEKAGLFGGGNPEFKLLNPLNKDLTVMRHTILPHHIDAAIRNANRGLDNVNLFELGPCYFLKEQHLFACGLRTGKNHARHWIEPSREVDVYDVKADVHSIFSTIGDFSYQINTSAPEYYHPGRKGCFKQGNKVLAYFGELHPQILRRLDTNIPMVAFEVFLDHLPQPKTKKNALVLSPYQSVTRDFAFTMKDHVPAETLIQVIQKVDKTLIRNIQVFDVYTGQKVGENTKSIAIEVKLEPLKATLTEVEINHISTQIINAVTAIAGVTLRQE